MSMLNNTRPLQRLSDNTTINQEGVRVIVFAIREYMFALPIEAVLKIVPCPPLNSPIKNGIGMVDWEAQTVTIIDLYQKFVNSALKESESESLFDPRFLILTKTDREELCGFVIEKSPTLIDIPLNDIRSVPLSYRQVAELSFVSHMAILSNIESEKPFKVFLLGMSQIIANKLDPESNEKNIVSSI